jgi:hypothetical protein
MKIIQIATQYISADQEADIIGLDENGFVYYWTNIDGKKGWKLLKDNLNN